MMYQFKTVSPYNDERPEIIFKNVPDDFKFCEVSSYVNELKGYKVSFLIFFYKYDEVLFEQINALSKGSEFHHQHTHAYRIKDFMVGNFWSVEVLGEIPLETIDGLNMRFKWEFDNHLIKFEEETIAFRMAEEELRHASIGFGDPKDWTEEQNQRYNKAVERLRNETQYATVCIRRFIGFENHSQQLEINTACVWFDEPKATQTRHSLITKETDQWFMLMNEYDPSIRKRIIIDDSKEIWDELNTRLREVNDMFKKR